jgi:hypothetical protein
MDSLCDRRRSQIEPSRGFGDRATFDHHDETLKKLLSIETKSIF